MDHLRALTELQQHFLETTRRADAPSVALEGPARSLALLAWGRVGLDAATLDAAGIEVRGDRALAERVVGAGLTP